jgi:hypothetical protein
MDFGLLARIYESEIELHIHHLMSANVHEVE